MFQPARRVAVNLGTPGPATQHQRHVADPRGAVRFDLTDRMSVKGSFGVFSRTRTSPALLSQNEANKDLPDAVAYHTTVGLTHLLADDTRLTVEAYDKTYRDFPMDPTQPEVFVLDEYTIGGPSSTTARSSIREGALAGARGHGPEEAGEERLRSGRRIGVQARATKISTGSTRLGP